MKHLRAGVCWLLCGAVLAGASAHAAPSPPSATAPAAPAPIPTKGMVLWLSAAGAAVENKEVVRIRDSSPSRNDALRQTDPQIPAGNPLIARHEPSGQPVLRFNGAFCGYEMQSIANIRTAFLVVSKHPDAFKKFNERFVLGGKTKPEVDFHVGWHWTDVIAENWKAKEHGKAWFNGLECDPSISEFAPKLAVVTIVSRRELRAGLLARDRDFKDRSWHGDIAEVILYSQPLADADRRAVEDHLLKKYAITPFAPVVVSPDSVKPGHVKPPEAGLKK